MSLTKSRPKTPPKPVIWVLPSVEEKKRIRVAAATEGKSMNRFLLDSGLAAADKVLARA